MTEFKKEDSLGSLPEAEQEAYVRLIDETSQFEPRDSKKILESYGHPKYAGEEGQGVYTMLDAKGKLHWCPSGNELRRVHELNPSRWLTGPMFTALSVEDHKRFMDEFNRQCDNF
jgi:hypothetical protein